MQTENEGLELHQCVKFKFIDLPKNNGTKYVLIFVNPCEDICNSKQFVDFATAGRHLTLSTTCVIQANMEEMLSSRTRTLFFFQVYP